MMRDRHWRSPIFSCRYDLLLPVLKLAFDATFLYNCAIILNCWSCWAAIFYQYVQMTKVDV